MKEFLKKQFFVANNICSRTYFLQVPRWITKWVFLPIVVYILFSVTVKLLVTNINATDDFPTGHCYKDIKQVRQEENILRV